MGYIYSSPNLRSRGCTSQEIHSKGDFPELPKQNSVAPVLETQGHRFVQWWNFQEIFGGKVSLD
jgi:hypothetical protein